ncbi:MAG: phosphomannomutase/phosphoglucomutase [Candidatus Woesearchaeota archaeon]
MTPKKDYSSIFKAYDLRGIYQKELDDEFAYLLGRAFITFTKAKTVAVGYDGRRSSPKLFENLKKGLLESGADVIDLGLISTPMSYFSVIEGKYDAGITITASHNPPQWNGFKLMQKKAEPLYSENGAQEILRIIELRQFIKSTKKGKTKKKNYAKEYEKFLAAHNKKTQKKELKIVIDQSNGSGKYEVETLKKLYPKSKTINTKITTKPIHEPNPLSHDARKQLVQEVKKQKADLGIIFDGDADRVCFVNNKGQFIRPDLILTLLSKELKRGTVIYDTRSSQAVHDTCKLKGLNPVMSKAGRTFIYSAMRDELAELGGENSGHYFFKESKYLDNAGICAIKVLNILKNTEATLSDLIKEYKDYHHSGEINYKVKNPSKAFLLVEQAYLEPIKTLFIDGLSIYYEDFWFSLRKSNTENIIRLNAEAKTKEILELNLKKIHNIMNLAK